MTMVGLVAAVLLFSLAPGAFAQRRDLRAEIHAVNDSMVAAFNRGDRRPVARFYTNDARTDGEGGIVVQGRDAVDRYWSSISGAKSWKLEVLAVGGHRDSPWQVGRSTLVQGGPNGDRASIVEFLAIWRRDAARRPRLAVDYYRY